MLYFAKPGNCHAQILRIRWPRGVRCPSCKSPDVTWLQSRNLYQCKTVHRRRQFSVKSGTIFESSQINLEKWFLAIWLLMNSRHGISSYGLMRTIGVTQKTAWFMLHRLRKAMQDDSTRLFGKIEMDECYIGGKSGNRHRGKRAGFGRSLDKTPVFGAVERGGRVLARVVPDAKASTLVPIIEKHILPRATIYTDSFPTYDGLRWMGKDHKHEVIDHSSKVYVRGQVHTNTIENFWSVLKRTLGGTYISVRKRHLHAYVAEQVFRFNHRKQKCEETRFWAVLNRTVGIRLTYRQLVAA